MKFDNSDLDWAAREGLIDRQTADRLFEAFQRRRADRPRFDAQHVAYYAGALLVVGAMGWFMGVAWEDLGGAGIFTVSAIYMLGFAAVGWRFWNRPGGRVMGGLLVTVAVAVAPLATYGLQRWLGVWHGDDPGQYTDFHHWIRSGWLAMELATVAAGLIALRFVRFPFVTAPIAFALWYMSMDLTPIIAGSDDFEWELRKQVSTWFGLAMIGATYAVDRRTREDFGFWGYLFGLISFWGGLTLMDSDSELAKFGYCLVNLMLIFASLFLRRRAFLVFGAFGVFGYLMHLAVEIFEDSVLFPFALTALGITVIWFGALIRRRGADWERAVIAALPDALLRMRPEERG